MENNVENDIKKMGINDEKRWELLIGDKQLRIEMAVDEQLGKCLSCLDSGGGGRGDR